MATMQFNDDDLLWNTDMYALFGVDSTATLDEIEKAFKVRCVKMHPRNVGSTLTTVRAYGKLLYAWGLFQSPSERGYYDQYREKLQEHKQKQEVLKKRKIPEDSTNESEEPANKRLKQWEQRMIAKMEHKITVECMDAMVRTEDCFDEVEAEVQRVGHKYRAKSFWDESLKAVKKNMGSMEKLTEFAGFVCSIRAGKQEYHDSETPLDNVTCLLTEINYIKSHCERVQWEATTILSIFEELESLHNSDEKDILVEEIGHRFNIWKGLDGLGASYFDDYHIVDDQSDDDESADDE